MPKRTSAPNANAHGSEKAGTFGDLLRGYRSRAGYSQEYLAEKARISSETIGALERGVRRAPNADTVEVLCDALELAPAERLDLESAAADVRARSTRDEPKHVGSTGGTFGERLRELRSAIGMSQDELARRAGLSTAGVSALERGIRRSPQRETLTLLADALALGERERADFDRAAQRGRARSKTARREDADAHHNIPLQLTSFVGRSVEIEAICRLIDSERLVTVLGSGGVGKTRTALECATRLTADSDTEVRFVDLSPVPDGAFVAARIASAFDVRLHDRGEPMESLAVAREARRALLILDSCEHLIADATRIARTLLARCAQITILATSRESLRIPGEVVYRLSPLPVPKGNVATIAQARSSGAVELMIARALAANPEFRITDRHASTLVDVCRRLDGIPLAIELAAAQLSTLGLDALSRRLDANIGATRGLRDLPDRQQTMRETIAWSYDLLTDAERSVLRRLSIFAGTCTARAAQFVCASSDAPEAKVVVIVNSLVDKSLVNAVIDGEAIRYTLFDSTRTFARERLDGAEDRVDVSRRHARWLAEYGDEALAAYVSKPNLVWLDEFWPEIDDVRSALEWAVRSPIEGDALLAGRIAGSFRGLLTIAGFFQECRHWIGSILSHIDESQQPLVTANRLTALMQSVAGAEMLATNERLIVVLRRLDDRRRLATALSAFAICSLSCVTGSISKARSVIDEAWAIFGDEGVLDFSTPESMTPLAVGLGARIQIQAASGEFREARALLGEALEVMKRFGEDFGLGSLLNFGMQVEFMAGDIARALEYSKAVVELADRTPHGAGLLASVLWRIAAVLLATTDTARATAATRRALAVTDDVGDDELRILALQNLAALVGRVGKAQAAAELLGSIETWRDSVGNRRRPFEEAAYEPILTSLRDRLGTGIGQAGATVYEPTRIIGGRITGLGAAKGILAGSDFGAMYSDERFVHNGNFAAADPAGDVIMWYDGESHDREGAYDGIPDGYLPGKIPCRLSVRSISTGPEWKPVSRRPLFGVGWIDGSVGILEFAVPSIIKDTQAPDDDR